MNLSKNLSLYIIILLLIGCGTKSSNNFLAGYLSPGDFCSKGVASEKAYRFTNITPIRPGFPPDPPLLKSCSAAQCAAVHCLWYVSQSLTSLNNALPTEGIAVNDKHLPQPTFDLKITRIPGLLLWQISLVLNGFNYVASTDQIQLTSSPSADVTDQTWNGTTCVDSANHLNIIYVKFLNNINLLNDPNDDPIIPKKSYIQIVKTNDVGSPTSPPATGDFMVVQDYGI